MVPENKTCVKSTPIIITLAAIDNPTSFALIFSDYWDEFMDNAKKYVTVGIQNLSTTSFDYIITTSLDNPRMLEISLSYLKNISKGTEIFFAIDKPKDITPKSRIYIESFTDNTTLKAFIVCLDGSYFESGEI